MTPEQALEHLLAGANLPARGVNPTLVVVERAAVARAVAIER